MGGGFYSTECRSNRAMASGYFTKSKEDIFEEKSLTNEMNPRNVKIRESRDSKEHPQSLAIVLGLDVTGSMGTVPHYLVQNGLPAIMGKIIQNGINDPQMLFMGIGDHECDRTPLQVGQFESSDELLDKWLTKLYLEGGGGGNAGESYLLAWYFASQHTSIDCFEKRKEKGFLFTIGDEPPLKNLPAKNIKSIMGEGQFGDYDIYQLLEKAKERYNVYHLNIKEAYRGSDAVTINSWKEILGDNLINVDKHEDVAKIIAEIVGKKQKSIVTEESTML